MIEPFLLFDINDSTFIDLSDNSFPSILRTWHGNSFDLEENSTHFGFVFEDNIDILKDTKSFKIYKDMYFSINCESKLKPQKNSKGFVVSRIGYNGFFNIGGEIENKGRYKYIDGCSDSLLISPVKFGDPCLNLLYFPKNINQTPHTHPSLRIGMIVKGEGFCLLDDQEIELKSGKVFIINENILHSFKTIDSEMLIVVYHPESDFGPTDNNHPMINKTIINGISASFQ
ncbi:MAG: AraC family ligand binding domain-containing protein [Candidatus Sericytochromatia bacterium]